MKNITKYDIEKIPFEYLMLLGLDNLNKTLDNPFTEEELKIIYENIIELVDKEIKTGEQQ